MAESETIVFRGITFYRYPESPHRSDRVYFTPGVGDRQRGVRRLHEEIWQAEHGPIPDGHHVHHADHDPLNNIPGNLVLLTKSEHHRLHQRERAEPQVFSDAARAAAAAWHGSPEGLAWHREHAARTWDNRAETDRTCERCGTTYGSRSLKGDEKYCGLNCRAAARRASGVDDEDRNCGRCGATFRVNRYAKTRYCSRSCARRSRTVQPNARDKSGP